MLCNFFSTYRMGLAISLVAMEKEKVRWSIGVCLVHISLNFVCDFKYTFLPVQVWYHVCPNRGRGCYNTRLKEDGGCTIWYNEKEVNKDAHKTSLVDTAAPIYCLKYKHV